MPVSLKDIAAASGYSIPTVCQILSGKGAYSDVARASVLEAADRLGYVPNSSARTMQRGRFGCIGLVMSQCPGPDYLPRSLLGGIQEVLESEHLHLSLGTLPRGEINDRTRLPKILRELLADGLLVNYISRIPRALVDCITRLRMPAVWLNSPDSVGCVYPDDNAGGRTATEHLLSLGHRRIAYVDLRHPADLPVEDTHFSVEARFDGYRAAMASAGLVAQRVRPPHRLPDEQHNSFLHGWLGETDRATAAVTYADRTVLPLMFAAAQRGCAVPRDLSVITFCREPLDILGVPITTMKTPVKDVGREGARMLIAAIEQGNALLQRRALPPILVPGATSGPPP